MPTVTIDLDDNHHEMLGALAARQGISPEELLRGIVSALVHRVHSAQFHLPERYFNGAGAVSDAEVSAAQRFIEKRLGRDYPGLRRESVVYGLMLEAIERSLDICHDADDGFEGGYFFANEVLTDLLTRMKKMGKRFSIY